MYLTLSHVTGKMECHEGVPSLAQMQAAVGGYIEALHTVDSPFRDGHWLTCYVNEEGLLIQLPLAFQTLGNGFEQPIAGSVVFTAVRVEDGDTVALLPSEVVHITLNRLGILSTFQCCGTLIAVGHSAGCLYHPDLLDDEGRAAADSA